MEIEAELVILSTAGMPSAGSDELSRILHVTRDTTGFFLESHPKLKPIVAKVNREKCLRHKANCTVCQKVCPYGACVPPADGVPMEINPAMCHGCGACAWPMSPPPRASSSKNPNLKQP